jgi:hypothetical protein
MINSSRFKLVVVTALFSLVVNDAFADHSDGRRPSREVKEWWVYQELNILPGVVLPETLYRLGNEKSPGQLKYDGENQAVAGIYWGGINTNTLRSEGKPDVRFSKLVHDPNAGDSPTVSPNIQLNEAIAIHIEGGGYLVFDKKASKLQLGWRDQSRFNLLANNPDIYQWHFRDEGPHRSYHGRRDMKEKEILALYNSVAKAYLVFGGELGLTWVRE